MKSELRWMSGLIFATILGGCSTANLERYDEGDPIPVDVAQKLEEKFETQPVVSSKNKKTLVVKKKKAATASAVKNFFKYPNRRPKNLNPVWVGEELHYEASYFGVVAGTLKAKVLPFKELNGRKVYHLSAQIKSSKLMSLIYRVNDTVTSFWDYKTLISHKYRMTQDESKQTRDAREYYDHAERKVYYWNRWSHVKRKKPLEQKSFTKIPQLPQDSFSTIYFTRFQNLKAGTTIKVPVVSEGKTWVAEVYVHGKERIDTPMGPMDTIKIEPKMKYRGVLKQQGRAFVWLTDDHRRFMARLEAKVKIGKVVLALKRIDNPGLDPEKNPSSLQARKLANEV